MKRLRLGQARVVISGVKAVPRGTVAQLAYPRIGFKLGNGTEDATLVWADCERLLLPSIAADDVSGEMGEPAEPQAVVVRKCTVDQKTEQTYLDIEPAPVRIVGGVVKHLRG